MKKVAEICIWCLLRLSRSNLDLLLSTSYTQYRPFYIFVLLLSASMYFVTSNSRNRTPQKRPYTKFQLLSTYDIGGNQDDSASSNEEVSDANDEANPDKKTQQLEKDRKRKARKRPPQRSCFRYPSYDLIQIQKCDREESQKLDNPTEMVKEKNWFHVTSKAYPKIDLKVHSST